MLRATLEIPPALAAIGRARHFAAERLAEWGLQDLSDGAALMISELVTNALLHGRSAAEKSGHPGVGAVMTLILSDHRLRVEVRDASPTLPVVRRYSTQATTGRGMMIVAKLASDWGAAVEPGGKVVWFEMDAHRIEGAISPDGDGSHAWPAGRRP